MDKNLSNVCPIQNGLKQGEALLSLFSNFALEYAIRKDWNQLEHISSWSVVTILIY